jgi:PAS domain S-box-containing protein
MNSVAGKARKPISAVLARRLFDTSLDLILVTDRRGQFIEVSPSAMPILGYRPEEMIGRVGIEFIHSDDLESTRNEMREARRGRATRSFESRYVHKKGHAVTLVWNGVWSESEQLHFFIGRDVTKEKLVERMRDEFIATVSHELRTPLTSISGALGLLAAKADASLPVQAARLLSIAQSNSQRLLRLVGSILDMEKSESGKLIFALHRVEIKAAVANAIEMNQGFAESRAVRLRLDPASIGGEIRADPEWLTKIVTNLLSNAIKFSPAGEEVVVAVERRGETIRITVRDHGHGVPNDFKPRMFEKFAQADATDTRQQGGTGLGLSIVKQIVTRLGGEIGFSDAPGGGAIFQVDLPVSGTMAAEKDEPTQPAMRRGATG